MSRHDPTRQDRFPVRRRQLLTALGSTAAVAVAGCSGGDGGDGTDSGTDNDGGSDGDGATTPTPTPDESPLGTVRWGQQGADATRTHATDAPGVTASSPSTYEIRISHEPVLTDEVLIAGDAVRDLPSGEVRTELPVNAATTPALVGDRLVVLTNSGVAAVDPVAGEERWRFTTQDDPTQVVADRDRAYVVQAGPLSGRVTAFSMSEGERLWSVDRPGIESMNLTGGSTVALADNLYVFETSVQSTGSPSLVELSTADGSVVSSTENVEAFLFTPDGTRYVFTGGSDAGLVRRDSDGTTVWEGPPAPPLAVGEEAVYVPTSGDSILDSVLTALSVDDGSELWRFDTGGEISDVAVAADTVYAAANDRIYALSRETGERQAAFPEGAIQLAVSDGAVVALGGFGRLTVYTEP